MRPLQIGIDERGRESINWQTYIRLNGNQNCIYFSARSCSVHVLSRFFIYIYNVSRVACSWSLIARHVLVICNSHTSVGFRHVVCARYTCVYAAWRRVPSDNAYSYAVSRANCFRLRRFANHSNIPANTSPYTTETTTGKRRSYELDVRFRFENISR